MITNIKSKKKKQKSAEFDLYMCVLCVMSRWPIFQFLTACSAYDIC